MRKECIDCLKRIEQKEKGTTGNSINCYICKIENKTESEFYCNWEPKRRN